MFICGCRKTAINTDLFSDIPEIKQTSPGWPRRSGIIGMSGWRRPPRCMSGESVWKNIFFRKSERKMGHLLRANKRCPIFHSVSIYSAPFGQFFTHSKQSIHSVPFFRLRELSVASTSIGHTFLHLPQDTHLLLSH